LLHFLIAINSSKKSIANILFLDCGQFLDWITGQLVRIGDGRIVSILEGGYSLDGLATSTAAHVRALMGR
jgi:hypothetical protein